MLRLIFEKKENAVWISHLDLMRLFQRAFKRAGLLLTHTQGFNPRPSVSVALPLSVGVSSECELLDFDLEGETIDYDEICSRLNQSLVSGVRVLSVYAPERKIKEITFLHTYISLEYDEGIPVDCESRIDKLFSTDSLPVPKRGKNGVQDQDIIPLVRSLCITRAGENEITLNAVIHCQNPSLNPMQLVSAIELYIPEMKPDFAKCRRVEIFDKDMKVFR